jgi:hypothetical protein
MNSTRIIREALVEKYGDLASPRFDFVQKDYDRSPYKHLIIRLAEAGYDVEETTDLNDDVCVSLVVQRDGCVRSVQLSLIARYAVILEVTADNQVQFAQSAIDHELSDLLEEEKVQVLAEDVLSEAIEFGGDFRPLYALVFSDVDVVPWQEEL